MCRVQSQASVEHEADKMDARSSVGSADGRPWKQLPESQPQTESGKCPPDCGSAY